MNIVLDMNLSPRLRRVLSDAGHNARHWSEVGGHDDADATIMEWARIHGFVVVTNDLDFGAILAATGAKGPSVIQFRTRDIAPGVLGGMLLRAIREHETKLHRGSLIIIDHSKSRVRVLPLDV